MRTLPAPVSVVCAVAILLAGVAGAWHERARATELRAQCLFADPRVDLAAVPRDRLGVVLEAHAKGHGWRPERTSDLGAPTRCPDAALDHLHGTYGGDREFTASLAVVLERNGRVDTAFASLRQAIAAAGGEETPGEEDEAETREEREIEFEETAGSRLAELGSRLALRNARHEDVVEFAAAWKPWHWCGNCLAGRIARKADVLGKALAALGREEDLVALAADVDFFDPNAIAIEHLIRFESTRHAGTAIEEVVESHVIPRYAAALDADRIRYALRNVIARRDAGTVGIDNADTLRYLFPERVEAWLISIGPEGRTAVVEGAIAAEGPSSPVCDMLRDLGAPEALAWIERKTGRATTVADYTRTAFATANRRWRVLAGDGAAYDLLLESR